MLTKKTKEKVDRAFELSAPPAEKVVGFSSVVLTQDELEELEDVDIEELEESLKA